MRRNNYFRLKLFSLKAVSEKQSKFIFKSVFIKRPLFFLSTVLIIAIAYLQHVPSKYSLKSSIVISVY